MHLDIDSQRFLDVYTYSLPSVRPVQYNLQHVLTLLDQWWYLYQYYVLINLHWPSNFPQYISQNAQQEKQQNKNYPLLFICLFVYSSIWISLLLSINLYILCLSSYLFPASLSLSLSLFLSIYLSIYLHSTFSISIYLSFIYIYFNLCKKTPNRKTSTSLFFPSLPPIWQSFINTMGVINIIITHKSSIILPHQCI